MQVATEFISATPVLASLDIARSVGFYCTQLGFQSVYCEPGTYGIVARGAVSIHFWACNDRHIAESTSCRVRVLGVDGLYALCMRLAVVHPNAPLEAKPWGTREFGILDPDGNLVTFAEVTQVDEPRSADGTNPVGLNTQTAADAKSALLVVDVQRALSQGEYAAHDVDAVITRINSLSARARAAGAAVILVQHEEDEGPMLRGADGWQLAEALVTQATDLHVYKKGSDAFHQTPLHALLQSLGVTRLVVCGMQSDFCVDSTVRRALALGYPVELVQDAHTTLDNGVLSAGQIAHHHNTTLAQLGSYGPRVTLRVAADVAFLP